MIDLSIEVDDTTARFVAMLSDVLAEEPDEPEPERHESHVLAEVAMVHYEWQRRAEALRLLIGVRLTNAALDRYEESS